MDNREKTIRIWFRVLYVSGIIVGIFFVFIYRMLIEPGVIHISKTYLSKPLFYTVSAIIVAGWLAFVATCIFLLVKMLKRNLFGRADICLLAILTDLIFTNACQMGIARVTDSSVLVSFWTAVIFFSYAYVFDLLISLFGVFLKTMPKKDLHEEELEGVLVSLAIEKTIAGFRPGLQDRVKAKVIDFADNCFPKSTVPPQSDPRG